MLFVGNQESQSLSGRRGRPVDAGRGAGRDSGPGRRVERAATPPAAAPTRSFTRAAVIASRSARSSTTCRNRFLGRIRQARLSQAAIDVLAIVAYQQPLTAEQVHKQRGKPSGHVLAQLVHRGLLRIERRAGQAAASPITTPPTAFFASSAWRRSQDLPQCEELDRQ